MFHHPRFSTRRRLPFPPIPGLFATLLLITGTHVHSQTSNSYIPNQIIIKFKPGAQQNVNQDIRAKINDETLRQFRTGAELWRLSKMSVEDAVALYQNDPRLEYIEPNYIVSIDATTPNDPDFDQLWGLHNTGQFGATADADIDAPEAWDVQTGADVLVGVIDTGVDWEHEDLAANIWQNPGEIAGNGRDDDNNGYVDDVHGWDFANNDSNPMDDNGHGTHVSGTIAAVGNNGLGVTGVCWSAQIMALKFLDSGGSGSVSDAISALEYATMMGARLTSNSWGGDGFSQALQNAIVESQNAGLLFIAAAGNDGSNNDSFHNYPSDYSLESVISVAATTDNDRLSSFSNYGEISVDLGAPGSDIYSTLPFDRYGSLSGTSMATPHVSGVAALIWAENPNLTAAQVKDRILNAVDPLPDLEGLTVTGGRLNVYHALVGPDDVPPATVADLAVVEAGSNTITLQWTATGDNGAEGTAGAYDVRYGTAPITEANFAGAAPANVNIEPQPSGATERFTVTGLNFNTTYFFALKVADKWGNVSAVSNSPSGTTLGMPQLAVSPGALNEFLQQGGQKLTDLTISNIGDGTLTFDIVVTGSTNAAGQTAARNGITQKNNLERVRRILSANAKVKPAGAPAFGSENTARALPFKTRKSAEEIWRASRLVETAQEPILAVVLDGVGTQFADLLLWDALNADWSLFGDIPILIDYSTFDGATITYADLLSSGADVVIITDNWNPTFAYGAFTAAEAQAIAQYVNDGAGLYISAGTFNNGEYQELQNQVEFLAPLVGLNPNEVYFWKGNDYDDLIITAPEHPALANITSPYGSGYRLDTLLPVDGFWSTATIPDGTILALSQNEQTVLVANGNRIFHSGLPEHESGTEADRQFLYNVITLSGQQPEWLAIDPHSGSVAAGANQRLSVILNAADLQTGQYAADIAVNSNDPGNAQFTMPVALTVTEGAPVESVTLSWCRPVVSNSTGERDTLFVCVEELAGTNVLSYQLTVTFDEAALQPVGAVSEGTISASFGAPTANTDTVGQVTVGGFGTQPLTGSGLLVGLIFDVMGEPNTSSEVCFAAAQFNDGDPAAGYAQLCSRFDILDSGNQQFSIAGTTIYGITKAPAGNVTLNISGDVSASRVTGLNGEYLFDNVAEGGDYSIVPYKTGDFDDFCITCYDAALAAQSAVGLLILSPEQQQAADVDENGEIFTFDAALLCRYAVGLPPLSDSEQTGQWRFDPRSRTYTSLTSRRINQNFSAVLLGDVDGNWKSLAAAKANVVQPALKPLADLIAAPGDTLAFPIYAGDDGDVLSANIDLEYDPAVLTFLRIDKAAGSDFQLLVNAEKGRIRAGAFGTEAITESGVIFTVQFKVVGEAVKTSEILLRRYQTNNSPATAASANVNIVATKAALPHQFTLAQNYPNPFNPQTQIEFDIPQNAGLVKTRLAIYSSSGQLVRVLVNEERAPGAYNTLWDGRDDFGRLAPSGVYLYRLTAGDFTSVKKLTMLK